MGESTHKLFYRRGGQTYPCELYASPSDFSSYTNKSIAVRVGGTTLYVPCKKDTDTSDSYLRAMIGGETYIVKNCAILGKKFAMPNASVGINTESSWNAFINLCRQMLDYTKAKTATIPAPVAGDKNEKYRTTYNTGYIDARVSTVPNARFVKVLYTYDAFDVYGQIDVYNETLILISNMLVLQSYYMGASYYTYINNPAITSESAKKGPDGEYITSQEQIAWAYGGVFNIL